MSYALIVGEVRQGVFEERNLDSFGLAGLLGKSPTLLIPEGEYAAGLSYADRVIQAKMEENTFLNPLNCVNVLEEIMGRYGKPDVILFTHSSSGSECASYAAGFFGFPIITDVSALDKETGAFHKSYYSDKIFGQFKVNAAAPWIITVRSGSFKEWASEKGASPQVEAMDSPALSDARSFVEYVAEDKGDVDITKADFLLSVGRGIGNKDEIEDYEHLAGSLKAVLSGSRPVIDKMWLPKARQVGTSGKTVKPRVYLAMGISGAFQHIAGMKDADCIIAVNKDPEAPIFQYAHYGVVADMHKVRDKLKDILKG